MFMFLLYCLCLSVAHMFSGRKSLFSVVLVEPVQRFFVFLFVFCLLLMKYKQAIQNLLELVGFLLIVAIFLYGSHSASLCI